MKSDQLVGCIQSADGAAYPSLSFTRQIQIFDLYPPAQRPPIGGAASTRIKQVDQFVSLKVGSRSAFLIVWLQRNSLLVVSRRIS
jgi:hypothetical protein